MANMPANESHYYTKRKFNSLADKKYNTNFIILRPKLYFLPDFEYLNHIIMRH